MATEVAVPPRIARLPRDQSGYHVPWFVAWFDGVPDFRVIAPNRVFEAISEHRCWICGDYLRRQQFAFVIGPMCAVTRISSEPPSHRDCAVYAAKVCPFLTNPAMKRRESHMPEGASYDMPGLAILRNPGVALVWVTDSYSVTGDGAGGTLFEVGEPLTLEWYCEGRTATRQEVLQSIESVLPSLRGPANREGPLAAFKLDVMVAKGLELLPP